MNQIASMNDTDLFPKRVRRCEVSSLIFAEELAYHRASLRALYDAVLLLCRRLPESALGSAPADALMLPPWHENPKTGNVLPPPPGLDLDQKGLGAFRLKLTLLAADQLSEIHRIQNCLAEHNEKILKREAERAARLKKDGPTK